MKYNFIRSAPWLMLILPLAFSACVKDSATRTYTIYKPVFASKTEVLARVGSHAAKEVKKPGKIYVYGQYIFLNELNNGVHIIDNSNPADPKRVAFIDIPGNIDIAIKGNILYADVYTDLLAIDISNPLKATIAKKVDNVFPERSVGNSFIADATQYIVNWIKKDTTVAFDVNTQNWNGCVNCGILMSSASPATKMDGVAGSMSRFVVVNNFLYTVSMFTLAAHDISNPADPQKKSEKNIGLTLETIYPFKDKLFLGSTTGMAIFDLSNPSIPTYISALQHFRSCDPVVANDNYAFVTLRGGTICGGGTDDNRLEVIDVQNISRPTLARAYSLTNPYGLGLDGNLLWICDGTAGLKLYDASSPTALVQLKSITSVEAHDVIITSPGKMLVTSKEGLLQYDYSDRNNIKLISKLSIAGF